MVRAKTIDEGVIFSASQLGALDRILRDAEFRFSSLERLLTNQAFDGKATITSKDLPYMLVAAFAIAKLERLGKEQLLTLERSKTVHQSTISGLSLDTAYAIIERFLHGDDKLNKDQLEQLGRVCYSARHLYEEGYF